MYTRRIIIAMLILLFISIINGPCLADTRCGEKNVRGIVCKGIFISSLEGYREIPPGGNATFEMKISSNLYNNTEVWLWLDRIPEFWEAELNTSHFNLDTWERITVKLKVSTPPTASVNYEAAIKISGMYISEDYSYVGSVFPGIVTVRIIGPDLKINKADIDLANGNPDVSQSVGLMATIYNIGDVSASNISVRFLIDGNQVGEVKIIPILFPGKSVLVFETWRAVSGNHTITVEVDYKNSIQEYSEINNVASTTISVEGTPFKWTEYITALSVVLWIPLFTIVRGKKNKE